MIERNSQNEILNILFAIDNDNVEIPDEVLPYFLQLKTVSRYNDPQYIPLGVIEDNTYLHSIRLAAFGKIVPQANVTRLLVHDFDELGLTRDTISLDSNKRTKMKADVRKIDIPHRYIQMIEQFHQASDFFKGKIEIDEVEDQTALIDKTIDEVENRLIFHYFFTQWLQNPENEYNGEIPPKAVFEFTRTRAIECISRLEDKQVDSNIYGTCISLYELMFSKTVELWEKVDKEKIPKTQNDEIREIRELLESERFRK